MSVIYPKRVKTIAKSGSTLLSGDVTISQGTNVTLTQSGQDISIAAASTGAPTDATYVTLSTNGTLSAERVLTGTANQITVTDNGAGSTVVLSLPQSIHTAATPQFAKVGIGIAAGNNYLNIDGGTETVGYAMINMKQTWNAAVDQAAIYLNITDTSSNAASDLMQLNVGGIQKFEVRKDGSIVQGIWSATTVAVNKGGTGQTSYTNGQLLIGNTTGNTLTKATLTGTANQVVVTNSTGSITLSTPQDIATTSSPQFANLTITGGGDIKPSADSTTAINIAQANGTNFVSFDSTNKRVGINVTPTRTLDISDADVGVRVISSTGTNKSFMAFNNTGGDFIIGRDNSVGGGLITSSAAYAGVISVEGAYPLQLGTNSIIRATIDNAGNVGIGTTAPAQKLVVADSGISGVFTSWQNADTGFLSSDGFSVGIDSNEDANVWNRENTHIIFATNNTERMRIVNTGAVIPGGNKTIDLGATGTRWNNIFYASATTGTSRLAPTNEICDHCLTLNKTNKMVRGTGTTIYLGETADYMTVWCEECGHSKRMILNHLPTEKLVQRKPAPMIIFEGLEIKQYSGRSRGIQVKFRYGEDDLSDTKNKALRNSTYLSDVEYDNLKAMTEVARKAFIKQLGQREWDAMEEVRLMKETCDMEQIECDLLVAKFNGKDLLIA